MTFDNSTVRALVLYQAPDSSQQAFISRAFRRCLSGADRLFATRKKIYYSLLGLSFLGFFFGSYLDVSLFHALSHLTLFAALRLYTLVIFFFGISIWGIAFVPLSVFLSSCTVGIFIRSCSALTFDCASISLAIFFFCLFLFASESLCAWFQCRSGWKAVVRSRGILFYILLFIICFILSF